MEHQYRVGELTFIAGNLHVPGRDRLPILAGYRPGEELPDSVMVPGFSVAFRLTESGSDRSKP